MQCCLYSENVILYISSVICSNCTVYKGSHTKLCNFGGFPQKVFPDSPTNGGNGGNLHCQP